MNAFSRSLGRTRRGAGVLGLLIVVVIILLIVVFASPLAPDKHGVTQAQTQITRARDIACDSNINTAYNQLMMLRTSESGGGVISLRVLKKKGMLPDCQGGGEYILGKDGKIYCTKHSPPPAEVDPRNDAATSSTQAADTPAAQ